MAKPSQLPDWDTTEVNSIEPDVTHKAQGWLAPGGVPEKPPFETFNHWMNAVWKWIKEFNRQGVVEWDGTTTYEIDDITKGSDGRLYSSLVASNTNKDPLISPAEWIDVQWRNQTTTHDILVDADYTLTALQNRYGRIVLTDTGVNLTAPRNIITDNIQKSFIAVNNTLQDLTFKTSGGTGILIEPSTSLTLYNDGTNVISNEVVKYGNNQESIVKPSGLTIKNQCTAWGIVDVVTTSLSDQFNVSAVVKDSPGNYTITFQTAMDNENFSAVGSAEVSGRMFAVTSKNVNGFSLNMRLHDGTDNDVNFSFHVVGGKN